MPNDRIAVIGDSDSVLAFRALGVDVWDAQTVEEGREKLKKCAREYSVILLSETLAEGMEDLIRRYKRRAYPIVLPIPTAAGGTGYGMRGVREDVEKAIGTDVLFNR